MKSRIFLKLFVASLVVIAACTLTMNVLIQKAWEGMLRSEIESSLRQKTLLFASRVASAPPSTLQQITKETAGEANERATVIDSSGKVLADSEANPATMENHASRPEFASALQGQMGAATRSSHTVGVDFLYEAAPFPGGAVRLAHPLSAIRDATAIRVARRRAFFGRRYDQSRGCRAWMCPPPRRTPLRREPARALPVPF